MTKTITINVPKPGDTLPFIVAEWEDLGYRFHAGYNTSGNAFVEGKKINYVGPYDIRLHGDAVWAIFALLELPMSVKSSNTVAKVTE